VSRRPPRRTRRSAADAAAAPQAIIRDGVAQRLLLGLAACGAVAGSWAGGGLPTALAVWYLLASAASVALYGIDKRAAQRQARRIPERTLQLLAAGGGWPGALLAQALFRHKYRKPDFQWIFLLCAVANIAVTLALLRLLAAA